MAEAFAGITGWTIADKVVAYLFIMLLFWGAKIKFGKKDEFNEDFLSLDAMKSIRGIAAIGVILHHISQEYFFQEEGILSLFAPVMVFSRASTRRRIISKALLKRES